MTAKQVNKEHYTFGSYLHHGRWNSYYEQIKQILALEPNSVLEVGGGDRVLASYLKNNTSISYKSVDIAEDLAPDVIGDVRRLPFPDDSFDTVVAFQVLEHVPFSDFSVALKEMKRVARKNVIISLPHYGPRFQFFLKLPFLPELKLALKIPWPKEHKFNGEHYWEIGKKNYSVETVRRVIKSEFTLTKDYVPFWYQYHRFFVCRVN